VRSAISESRRWCEPVSSADRSGAGEPDRVGPVIGPRDGKWPAPSRTEVVPRACARPRM